MSIMSLSRTLGTTTVSEPSVAEWTRPEDWLALPVLASDDQKVVGLIAIFEDANFLSLSAAGNYTVDWGDGVIENYSTGVQSYHTYNYASISNDTLCSRGYKQVIVTITPQSGQNLTTFNLGVKHNQTGLSNASTPWLDIAVNGSNITSMTFRANTVAEAKLLEQVTIGTIGSVTSFTSMFQGCRSLQSVPLFNTASGTNFSSMFGNCSSLRSVPLFNTASGTNFTYMFSFCSSLTSVPLFNTASGTNFGNMFANCFSLQSVPLFNTASGTGFSSMFGGCSSLQSVPLFNTASGTNFGNMFSSCTDLSQGALSGTRYAISYASCKLARAEIVEIFNALGTAVGTPTITVTGNYGAASLTAGDIAIATGKGWTVAT